MSRAWTDAEQRILIVHYPDKGPDGIKRMLPRRSRAAIIQAAYKAGCKWKVHPTYRAWSKREMKILAEVYPAGGSRAVHAKLPSRSINACRVMARKAKIYRHGPRPKAVTALAPVHQDNRPLTFAERLERFEAGQGVLAPTLTRHHLTPTVRRAA